MWKEVGGAEKQVQAGSQRAVQRGGVKGLKQGNDSFSPKEERILDLNSRTLTPAVASVSWGPFPPNPLLGLTSSTPAPQLAVFPALSRLAFCGGSQPVPRVRWGCRGARLLSHYLAICGPGLQPSWA